MNQIATLPVRGLISILSEVEGLPRDTGILVRSVARELGHRADTRKETDISPDDLKAVVDSVVKRLQMVADGKQMNTVDHQAPSNGNVVPVDGFVDLMKELYPGLKFTTQFAELYKH